MRRTKEEAEATKAAILQSALNTFCEKGYAKTTFDEIAKRINLTKGAIYWHFRSKPDLLAALIDDYSKRQWEFLTLKQSQLCAQSLNDILNHFLYRLEFIMSSQSNRKVCFFLVCQMEWSEGVLQKLGLLPQISQTIKLWHDLLKQSLLNLQKKGEINDRIDAERLAHIILNSYYGLLGGFYGHRCQTDVFEILKDSFDIIFNGLKIERTK